MDEASHLRREPKLSIRTLGTDDSKELHRLYMTNVAQLKQLGLHEEKVPMQQQISQVLSAKEGADLFGIFEQHKLIGVVHVKQDAVEKRTAEIGRVIDFAHQNKGIGGKALMMVMDALSGRYDHFFAITGEDNILARKSLEKIGFLLESAVTDDTPNVLYTWHR